MSIGLAQQKLISEPNEDYRMLVFSIFLMNIWISELISSGLICDGLYMPLMMALDIMTVHMALIALMTPVYMAFMMALIL